MTGKSEGAVVLLSGGMDSTVLLHHVAKTLERTPTLSIGFNYGQRHVRELDCAAWPAGRAGVAEHRVIDLPFVADLVKTGTSLVVGGNDVPDLRDLDETELSQPPTYVPNRNMMFLSTAVAFAEAQGIRDVFYGAQAHDEYGYWDCTAAFLDRMNATLALNRKDAVNIHAPFVTSEKNELVTMGLDLGVDFAHTWSCYRGGDAPCGTCPTCVERQKAFQEAGEPDPLAN